MASCTTRSHNSNQGCDLVHRFRRYQRYLGSDNLDEKDIYAVFGNKKNAKNFSPMFIKS